MKTIDKAIRACDIKVLNYIDELEKFNRLRKAGVYKDEDDFGNKYLKKYGVEGKDWRWLGAL